MTASDYLVDILVQNQVTDAFGIPGGVILDLIYAIDRREGIEAHLSYHEQAAGFAAEGYAQASGKIGVAYATRGPGLTNMITCIADAYCDSIPVLFITAHSSALNPAVRLQSNQEIDTCAMVKNVTKYAKRVDSIEEFAESVNKACSIALEGRKGPVFLDIASSLWKKEVLAVSPEIKENDTFKDYSKVIEILTSELKNAKRPVILIGDGVNQTKTANHLKQFVEKIKIPVLSSRYAHHTVADSPYYCGYIGGFGVRYANFILSKTDLIISLGNRLNFPLTSQSYKGIPYQAKIVRFDIDNSELGKEIPNSIKFEVDLASLLPSLARAEYEVPGFDNWLNICDIIKKDLWDEDVNEAVKTVDSFLKNAPHNTTVLNDVGNNEFWISRACVHTAFNNQVLYSKSFASLGCSMTKAIGAYYATSKPILCFIGDQGFQMNSQELQYISQHKLPITIVVMNNYVSGMIRDKEVAAYQGHVVHSTFDSGYGMPNLQKLAETYGVSYLEVRSGEEVIKDTIGYSNPLLVNLTIDEGLKLSPKLPLGRAPHDMVPELETSRYQTLNEL